MADNTGDVLKAMFTENTGAHMLDSGGVYGRHFEKNAARDFDSEPAYIVEASIWGGKAELEVQANTYQWLSEKLQHAPELQEEFDGWVADPENEREHCHHLADMEEWIEHRFPECGGWEQDGTGPVVVNTYNHESILDQTLQFAVFTPEDHEYEDALGDSYVLLQVHGGCDVRGGYTAPRVFRICGDSGGYSMAEDGMADAPGLHVEGQIPAGTVPLPGVEPPPIEVSWYCDGSEWEHEYAFDSWGKPQPKPRYLSDFPATTDASKRGKGEVYVDEDARVAYCPITGAALTF